MRMQYELNTKWQCGVLVNDIGIVRFTGVTNQLHTHTRRERGGSYIGSNMGAYPTIIHVKPTKKSLAATTVNKRMLAFKVGINFK